MQFANNSLTYRISEAVATDLAVCGYEMAHIQHIDPANDGTQTTGQTFAIATILVIVEIISALVTIYQTCKKTPAQSLADMGNPSLLSRIRLRKEIARHPECNGCGRALHAAVLTRASKCTIVDVEQLYRENV